MIEYLLNCESSLFSVKSELSVRETLTTEQSSRVVKDGEVKDNVTKRSTEVKTSHSTALIDIWGDKVMTENHRAAAC